MALASAPTPPMVAPTRTSGPNRVWRRRTSNAMPAAAHRMTRTARTTSAELGDDPTNSDPIASASAGSAATTPTSGVARTSVSPLASGVGTDGRSVTTAMVASGGSVIAALLRPQDGGGSHPGGTAAREQREPEAQTDGDGGRQQQRGERHVDLHDGADADRDAFPDQSAHQQPDQQADHGAER